MSYRDDDNEGATNSGLKKLMMIGVGVVAFFVAKTVVHEGINFADRKTKDPAKVERMLQSDPLSEAFYGTLKREFPDDYNNQMSEIAAMVRRNASNAEIKQYAFTSSQQFVKNHIRDIAAASNGTLVKIAVTHAALARSLAQESPSTCAQFGFSKLSPDSTPQLSKGAMSNLGDAGGLMIIAAHEGEVKRVQRATELSDKDSQALVDAVRAQGLSDQETSLLFSDKAKEASVSDQCKMTVALYGAIANLPPGQSAEVMAVILQSAVSASN